MRVGFIAIVGLIAVGSAGSQSASARDLELEERQVIEAAVKDQLKDPTSPMFKWLPLSAEQPESYCALVNAKNSFGAYIGFTPYLVSLRWTLEELTGGKLIAMGNGDAASPRTKAVLQVCADHGYADFSTATGD